MRDDHLTLQMDTHRVDDARIMDMVQILTHRISSLTAGVQGYADLLTETLATAEQRKLARSILEGAARIDGIMGDLRLFSRPIIPSPVPVTVDRLIGETLALVSEKARPRVLVSNEVPRSKTAVADPELTRQALFAILKNALEATPRNGEVRLYARECDDGFVELAVENEGTPIMPQAAPRIFDPFFTTKAQNLGLGLTLARNLARGQGGGLELDSAPADATTRVVLSIPTSRCDKL